MAYYEGTLFPMTPADEAAIRAAGRCPRCASILANGKVLRRKGVTAEHCPHQEADVLPFRKVPAVLPDQPPVQLVGAGVAGA